MNRKDFIKNIGLGGIGWSLFSRTEILTGSPTIVMSIGTRVPGCIGQSAIQLGIAAYHIIDRPTYSEQYFGVPRILLQNEHINYNSDFGWFDVDEGKLISGAYRAFQKAMPGVQKMVPHDANVLIVAALGCASTLGSVRAMLDFRLTTNSIGAVVTLPFGFERSRAAALSTFDYIKQKCDTITCFDLKVISPDTILAGAHRREQLELVRMVNQVFFDRTKLLKHE